MLVKRDHILLAHGGGGSLTRELIERMFLPALDNAPLRALDDAAVLDLGEQRLAFTTDSFVVHPRFFPGGDIGTLAVCGTVNDLAVLGAQPLWMSLGLILEEGLPLAELQTIIESIRKAAKEAGVEIVTGDTKVVERGKCDGIFINTTGIGRVVGPRPLGANRVQPGDAVLVNGPLGDHGIAVLSQRPGISFQTSVTSDCASLWPLVKSILESGAEVHAMRDATRGGLAAVVCEIAKSSNVCVRLRESELPIHREVNGACELLGLDPIHIANEGKVVVFCRGADAGRVLAAMQSHPLGTGARVIGEVAAEPCGRALLRTTIGGERIIDLPAGEDLPRIC